jgi:hypothetical protein
MAPMFPDQHFPDVMVQDGDDELYLSDYTYG